MKRRPTRFTASQQRRRFQSRAISSYLRPAFSTILSVVCTISIGTFGIDLPAIAAIAAVPAAPANDKKSVQDPAVKGLPITELSADEAILHALNRLAYGPRPGDIERVRQMGLAKWIDQQLAPNSSDARKCAQRNRTVTPDLHGRGEGLRRRNEANRFNRGSRREQRKTCAG